MPESVKTRLAPWGFNLFSAYCGTGARLISISGDWREVRVRLPLTWRTRIYAGRQALSILISHVRTCAERVCSSGP